MKERLYSAEIDLHGGRVLDVGHGTGWWAFQLADKSEKGGDVEIFGIDLADITSEGVSHPTMTLNSAVDFTNENWGFSKGSFDLIHMGQLCGSVADWPRQYALVKA